ncbi:hypothetical protein BBO99_00004938 [Phytophthora kernoviae]|uniref:Cystatin domain-containing protein n=1 Tax=Phytophthora kernoviae TaxID=325452 RepID=A0A3R7KU92_9STRA|nr:hypothetical protein JM16_008872 [Phytophthora kernoviae]RLN05735.1 hypothetical protein BBI17_008567 [Phytophthora kernoviae]RLN79904.1 hypothetical protein BBO99_00004938 [Phytophthora kernoviae]
MVFLRTAASLIAAGMALLTAVPAQDTTMVGTWKEATVTDADVNLLTQAAGNASYYAPEVTTAICLIAIEGLWTQTVAGTNYKFQVAGCAVNDASGLGPCVDRECSTCQAAVYHLVGNWMTAAKNVHTEDLLAQALQKQNTKLKSPLCFTEVTYIEQQIVNGIHFRYHILGCETTMPGRCSSDCATPSKYNVEVFAQPWADVVQVISGVQVQ